MYSIFMPCFSVIEKFIDLLEKSTFYKVYIISKIHNTFVWLLETVCIKLPCKDNSIDLGFIKVLMNRQTVFVIITYYHFYFLQSNL